MDEIMRELDTVYRMVSSLTVNGDNVDIVAAVRSKLRKIGSSLNEEITKQTEATASTDVASEV